MKMDIAPQPRAVLEPPPGLGPFINRSGSKINKSPARFDDNAVFRFPAHTVALMDELAAPRKNPSASTILGEIDKHVRYGSHRFSSRLVLFVTEKTELDKTRLKSVLFVINRIPYNVTDMLLRPPSAASKTELSRTIATIPSYYREQIIKHDTLIEFLRAINFINTDKQHYTANVRYNEFRRVLIDLQTASFGGDGTGIMRNSHRARETINFPGGMGVFIPRNVNRGFGELTFHSINRISRSDAAYRVPNRRYRSRNEIQHTLYEGKKDYVSSGLPCEYAFYNYEPPCLTAGRETEEEMGIPFECISYLTRNTSSVYKNPDVQKFITKLTRNIHYRDDIAKLDGDETPFHPLYNQFSIFTALAMSMNVHYFSLNFVGFVDVNAAFPGIALSDNFEIIDRDLVGNFAQYNGNRRRHTFPESKKAKTGETDYVLSVPVTQIDGSKDLVFAGQELQLPRKIRAVLKRIISEVSDADYVIKDSVQTRIRTITTSTFT